MKQSIFINRTSRSSKPVLPVLLFGLVFIAAGFQKIQAQDKPFERLKMVADNQATLKSQLSPVSITKASPLWNVNKRTPIAYRPIEMKDSLGMPIPADKMMTLPNGQRITAREYFARVNNIERQLNAEGYTLREKKTLIVSKTVTPNATLNVKRSNEPNPIKPLLNETDLKKITDPTAKYGDVVLKPLANYTDAEKQNLNSLRIESDNGKMVAKKLARPVSGLVAGILNPNPVKVINETSVKDWSFGSASTFKAGIRGELNRFAKLYQFNPAHPEKSKSEFKLTASGKIYGALFNHSFDFVNAKATYYSPEDIDKKMTLKVVVSVVGITVLNLDKSYDQVQTITDRVAKNFDKSFPIRFPIIGPINFSGKVGVKGMVGFEYSGNLYRSFASIVAKPLADISGYAEAGFDVYVASVGVGGRLTFIKGNLDLSGFAGIIFQNPDQLVALVNYYVGYDLSILSGELYAYASFAIWRGEHTIFNWDGYNRSGTIAEGSKRYVIDNTTSAPLLTLSE